MWDNRQWIREPFIEFYRNTGIDVIWHLWFTAKFSMIDMHSINLSCTTVVYCTFIFIYSNVISWVMKQWWFRGLICLISHVRVLLLWNACILTSGCIQVPGDKRKSNCTCSLSVMHLTWLKKCLIMLKFN